MIMLEALDFDDILIAPAASSHINSRRKVDLQMKHLTPVSGIQLRGVPIYAAGMDGIGTFSMHHALKKYAINTVISKYATFAQWDDHFKQDKKHNRGDQFLAISAGLEKESQKTLHAVMDVWSDHITQICLDVANGHMSQFADFCCEMRKRYPDKIIIAGNLTNVAAIDDLGTNCGVDIVKIGIGSGSACTTRIKTGCGYPQASLVQRAACRNSNALIMSDGGCRSPGDLAKAFALGADFVMLGGMLAGHSEGETFLMNGGRPFYGMSSARANKAHLGVMSSYKTSEGRELMIPDRGSVCHTIEDILGGLRSALAYAGCDTMSRYQSASHEFLRVQNTHNRIFEGFDNG